MARCVKVQPRRPLHVEANIRPQTQINLKQLIDNFNNNKDSNKIKFYKGAVLILLVILAKRLCSEQIKICNLTNLSQQYSEQIPRLWEYLSINIENIINRRARSPFVFLFLHQNNKKMRQLVKDIAKQTSTCLGNKKEIIKLKPANFTSDDVLNDYGIIIKEYSQMIKSGGVVLVLDLNEIPGEAARALHTICDTETPIVKDVVIFLTLVTPIIKGNAIQIARDELFNLWSPKLQSNDIDALITRVTDNVMALKS